MLGQPQEGNEVVLVMGLWMDLVIWLPIVDPLFKTILQAALLILMSKMQLRGASQLTSWSLQRRRLQLWAVITAFLIIYALSIRSDWAAKHLPTYPMLPLSELVEGGTEYYYTPAFFSACISAEILTQVVAALLLIFRPAIIASLTSTSWGRRVVYLAKLISAVSLAFGSAVAVWPPALAVGDHPVDPSYFIIAFAVAVLSLGSLQTQAANSTLCGCRRIWIDVIMHIMFLWYFLITIPAVLFSNHLGGSRFAAFAVGLSSILLVAVLLMGNLQIPAAALQVLLSSSRFHGLKSDYDHPKPPPQNMVPAIRVFYVLALCQGTLYITASIVGLFSFFPRRSLVRHSKLFRGQRGAKAIDVYYECSYSTCMDTGLFAANKTLSLAGFATESLSSGSDEIRLAAVLILGNLLHGSETDSSKDLRSRIISSNKNLSTLIGMLGWADARHRDIRLIAARAIANMADSFTVAEIPSMLKLVSSLLDADNQPAGEQDSLPEAASVVSGQNGRNAASNQQTTGEQLEHGQDGNGWYYWVRQCWQRMKEKWSVLEEPPLTHQDSLPVLGMVILERLAHDPDNCAEIAKATYLISKIVRLISCTADSENSNDDVKQQHAVVFSSLNFVRRLAITGESIGASLRQELCKNSFLLNNLESVLEDSRISSELMKLVFEILAKLAFDKEARKEIASSKVTISKLMDAFIGKDGPTNVYYDDQSLRMAAGEALVMLTIQNPANCLAILEEPGYELIKDLKNMLCEDEYKYVAASLLQNVCAHSTDKLHHHQGSGDHLSSAIPMLMKNIMSAGGKQLEPLIGLVSEISNVIPEAFVNELQLQTNGSDLVQKLVAALNSNRKPNPEYPRLRRVVVEMVISIVKLCPRYATLFREGGMLEALNKVERTTSKVEEYRVFYGNVGVVLESGAPLAALAATAKGLVHSAVPTLGT
ncbi:unnamed protein product [Urochloa humidicola]